MLPMEIVDGIAILRPEGRFDSYKVASIDTSMEDIFDKTDRPQVIVNLMQVHFIDAAAIDTLQKWRDIAKERDGDIVLTSLRQTMRMRLNMQTLAQFLLFDDDEQAIAAIKGTSDNS